MTPSQYGRMMENLAENAWTAGSDGRLGTYVPVLDSSAVDRAVSAGGGPPLFVQVKAHRRARPGDRLAFALALADVGDYDRWLCLFLEGDAAGIRESYLVPGRDLLAKAARGTLVDGRACIRLTLSETSPKWSPYAVAPTELGNRLLALAQPPALLAQPDVTEREGAFFEESVAAALLGVRPGLAVYRPAVDLGRDLLVQRTGTPRAAYIQVKGTEREDRPGLVRFQVRRRAFVDDPSLCFLFAFGRAGTVHTAWLVPAPDLAAGAAGGDPEHISFEAHVEGADERWARYRLSLSDLASRLLDLL